MWSAALQTKNPVGFTHRVFLLHCRYLGRSDCRDDSQFSLRHRMGSHSWGCSLFGDHWILDADAAQGEYGQKPGTQVLVDMGDHLEVPAKVEKGRLHGRQPACLEGILQFQAG